MKHPPTDNRYGRLVFDKSQGICSLSLYRNLQRGYVRPPRPGGQPPGGESARRSELEGKIFGPAAPATGKKTGRRNHSQTHSYSGGSPLRSNILSPNQSPLGAGSLRTSLRSEQHGSSLLGKTSSSKADKSRLRSSDSIRLEKEFGKIRNPRATRKKRGYGKSRNPSIYFGGP